jgi:5-methylcytosine-specific restriction endonuclease McrBC regulatory subunit McrC
MLIKLKMPNHEEKPYLKKHQFTTDRDEPLTERIAIRVTKSMAEKIKVIDNYPEFCRQALQDALDKLEDITDE